MERHFDGAVRQGDVIMIPVTLAPTEIPEAIVASSGAELRGFRHLGERGDHAHVIEDARPVRLGSLDLLRLDRPAILEHREVSPRADAPHRPIPLPAGYYEPRIQRIWSPGRRLRFAD